MPRGRPPKEFKLSNAERKRRYRQRHKWNRVASAEAVDAKLLTMFRRLYEATCREPDEPPFTIHDIVDSVVSAFPNEQADRVRLRCGMPGPEIVAQDEDQTANEPA